MSSAPDATAYRADIDGLRAIAILAVVACHAGIPGMPGGFVGVDVFFVISGYLITGLLFQEMQTTGTVHLAAFYARRIRRLLPALVVVVVVTLVLGILLMFPLDLRRLGRSATAVMFVVSNIHFLRYSGGYFDPSSDLMPLLHTWSLSIEEQYYLTWPLILMAIGWGVRRAKAASAETAVLLALLAIMSISFVAGLGYLRSDQPAAFYLMPARAWELALGGFVWLAQRRVTLSAFAGGAVAAAGLAAIAATVVLLDDSSRFPGAAALPPTLGAAAVIFGLRYAGPEAVAGRFLRAGLMVRIGLLSYAWYLWHWPLLSLGRTYFLGARDPLRDGGIALLALVLAAISYRLVECPIRYRKPWLFATPRGTLVVGAGLTLFVAALAGGVNYWGKVLDSRLVEHAHKLAPAAEKPFGIGKCEEPKDGAYLAPQSECVLGGSPGITLAAWGDSHTGHLAGMLGTYVEGTAQTVLVRTSKACPPLIGALPFHKEGDGLIQCRRYVGNVISELSALANNGARGIILSARWNVYMDLLPTDPGRTKSIALVPDRDQLEGGYDGVFEGVTGPLNSAASARTLVQSLRKTLSEFQKLGLRVLIVAPTPELHFNGPQCIYRKSDAECVVPRHRVDERRALAVGALSEAAAGFDNVRVWDPIEQFCDARWCYTVRDGLLMYRDADHISGGMSRRLLAVARPHLDWLSAPR